MTVSIPIGSRRGSSTVASLPIVVASNTTTSATAPSRRTPRSRNPRRAAAADGILEPQDPLVAHELAEDPGVAAVGPGARLVADERAVRPDHSVPVPQEPPDPVRVGARRHLVRAEALLEEQVAEDVDRIGATVVDQRAQGAALERPVVREVELAEADVAEPTGARVELPALRQVVADPLADGPVGQPLLRLRR